MEIRQLRYFVKSAELLNFTAAAAECFITQGTLSQQLKQLEIELDTPLFDRIGKRIRLSDAGALFLPFAKQTIKNSEDGKQAVVDFKGMRIGEVRIGITYALTYMLAPAVANFSEQYPNVKIVIEFGTSNDLLQKLKYAKLDFVVCFGEGDKTNNIHSTKLFESRLALIMNPSHPLSNKESVSIQNLKDTALALPAKGFNTRSFIDKVFEENNFTPNINIELNDIHTLLELVKIGKWCTILSLSAVANEKNIVAVPFKGKSMVRRACISWTLGVYRKKAATILADLMAKA